MKSTLLLGLLLIPLGALAHPGRTASDGCHYCRTNCDYWGVPHNQRHCHYYQDPKPEDLKYSKVVKKYSDDETSFVTLLHDSTYITFEQPQQHKIENH